MRSVYKPQLSFLVANHIPNFAIHVLCTPMMLPEPELQPCC